jgi:hypothetical protein
MGAQRLGREPEAVTNPQRTIHARDTKTSRKILLPAKAFGALTKPNCDIRDSLFPFSR